MVSKRRYVGGGTFGGYNPADQIILASGFILDEPSRTLQFQAIVGNPGDIGDIVMISVKSGKSVEVGEINSIGTGGTIVVKELQELFWQTDFLRDLGRGDQKIFVGFLAPLVLGIEVSLGFGLSGGDRPFIPQSVDSLFFVDSLLLDTDGDNTITVAEAEGFVEKAKALIRSEGLTLGALAPSIPSELKVSGVDLSSTGTNAEETTMFNGIAAQVRLGGGKQFVYFQWTDKATPHGIGVNNFGDVVSWFGFDDFMKEGDFVRSYPYVPQGDERGWVVPYYCVHVIDKVGQTVVVKDEKIKSIKKVKKCGKCYYKLELADSGLVPTMHPGKYEDCLVFIWRNAA
jgi:hypothetical protein